MNLRTGTYFLVVLLLVSAAHIATAQAADCCAPGATTCQNTACVDCVNNAVGVSLCGTLWSSTCLMVAGQNCAAVCGCPPCGDGKCTAPESCVTCPADCGPCTNNCCNAGTGVGCADTTCMDCICDPLGGSSACCTGSWFSLCAAHAYYSCADSCTSCNSCGNGSCDTTESCSTCPSDCGPCAGDCCATHATSGCNDSTCQNCICNTYPSCCVLPWDDFCTTVAKTYCKSSCACAGCGDGICDTDESCTSCPSDCGDCADFCCKAHGSSGCGTAACETCVCTQPGLASCCFGAWNDTCAGVAATQCSESCACGSCGNGVCDPVETCFSCPQDCGSCTGSCCVPHGGTGCDSPQCLDCMVNEAPYCGYNGKDKTWYGNCAAIAAKACLSDCPQCNQCGNGKCGSSETCGTCPADCGACVGDCCKSHSTVGCGSPECQACVCAKKGQCCTAPWGDGCAQTASEDCAAVCLGCKPCGNGSCNATGGENCDNCPEDCGDCPKNCCEAHGGKGCETSICQTCVCQIDATCCTTTWDESCADLAASALCAPACPSCDVCGNGHCAFEETCLTCEADCGACVGDCCAKHSGQGCEDPACTDCVCGLSGVCCWYKASWNDYCAQLASITCANKCPCEFCGNGICGPTENCFSCVQDCQACGDGVCECTEDCANCEPDCGMCPYDCPVGDPNGDGATNVTDVQCGILVALAQLSGPGALMPSCLAGPLPNACDLDCGGAVNVTDVLLLISNILGKPLDAGLDTNGNGCVDACENTVCGDGLCVAGETLTTCLKDCIHPAAGCCSPGLHLPCTGESCLDCMCGLDASCCNGFSQKCSVSAAASGCVTECGCNASCCAPGGVGCLKSACATCVCAKDNTCCTVSWDNDCANLAKGACTTQCGCP